MISQEAGVTKEKRPLRDTIRDAWRRLRGGELTPARAAASVGVGLAIGVTPLYGFHLPLVLAVCLPLGLDAPVAYLAANISLPFIAPFLSIAEIEIGARILNGSWLALTRASLAEHGLAPFFRELVVGTIVFSPLSAFVGGAITFAIGSIFEKEPAPDSFEACVDRVAERYARGSRFTRGYVTSKMQSDPVVRAIFDRARENDFGNVADVGCGRGQLSLLLLEARTATSVRGFDWDEAKIAEAERAKGSLSGAYFQGDLRSTDVEPCDTALLVDVLHYLTAEEQDALLVRVARAASDRIFVRDLDPDRGWRSSVTRLQERVTTRLGVNRGARVLLRPIADMTAVLEREGFETSVEPCWAGTPFANVLVTAKRKTTETASGTETRSRTEASTETKVGAR